MFPHIAYAFIAAIDAAAGSSDESLLTAPPPPRCCHAKLVPAFYCGAVAYLRSGVTKLATIKTA